MTEEEYRDWLKEQGYSDHAIENQLRELREAAAPPAEAGRAQKEETAGSGLFDRLAKRRRQGGDDVQKKR